MKLILVTTPNYFVEEDKILTSLFEEGLDLLHLCKPSTAPMFAERLLTLIPEQYHKRIVVHGHFYLKEEFGLRGIHISERNNQVPENYKGHISSTCYSIDDISKSKSSSDYLILNPVFDSEGLSQHQTPLITKEMMRDESVLSNIDKRVMAFGGINETNISQIKDMGFGGAVVMKGLWDSFDACLDCDYHILIEQFRRLKKLCD